MEDSRKLQKVLKKMFYEVEAPPQMSSEQVFAEMRKVAHRHNCVVEYYCRGDLIKIKL